MPPSRWRSTRSSRRVAPRADSTVTLTKGLTPLVGREQEVGLLRERWAQVQDGLGQVVLLSGEAGIGKSRLVQALIEHLAGEAHTCIECHGSPYYQQSAFYPLVTHMQRLLRFRRDDTSQERLRTLEEALASYGFALEEVVPLFAALLSLPLPERYPPLSMTPQQQKQKTLEALLAWLLKEAERQPVYFVMEDLHWVDPSTLEFLSLLIEQVPTVRMLLLLVFRPDFRPPWALRSYLTPLALGRLSRRQVETMTERVTGGKALPAEVLRHVMTKTDGVPLFVEELTKMILESGLVKEREGQYELTDPLPALAIPTTLHDSLMARLDQWEAAKPVAQLGAVVGREFAYEVLQAVWPVEEDTLQQGLAQLVDAELLYQRGLLPQARYVFKHALIQEAAYQSLLRSTRRQYHQQIAQVLEARFPETRKLHPELLAHHAFQGEIWEKAIAYFRQAGGKAFARSANREAVACFEQALVALQHLPESRDTCEQAIALRLDLRHALLPLGEFERMFYHLREAVAHAQALDDQQRLGQLLWCMTEYFRVVGDYDRALESGERALAIASALEDFTIRVATSEHLGKVYHRLGDYRRAVDLLRWNVAFLQGERIYERFGMASLPSVHSRAWLARCLAELGMFAEGIVHGEEAVHIAEAVDQPYSLSVAYQGMGFLYLRKGDLHKAIPLLERGLEISREASILVWFAPIALVLSSAYALAGRVAEALPLLRQGLEQSVSLKNWQSIYWLSEVYPLADRMDEISELAARALEFFRAHKERGHQAWALKILGDIHSHKDPPEVKQAEACYREALALASELGMHPLLAQCHLGLGALYHQMGRLEEMRSKLSAAMEMYRAMEMAFWLTRAEATLAQAE